MSWSRSTAPFTLQVQFSVDDYRRYFAIVGKRQSNWVNFIVFVVALFSAVAVAFAFRALAARETADTVAIELAGRYSLFAYAVGVFAILLLGSFMRRQAISSSLAGTPNAFDPKTIVLDNDAVSVAGALSNVRHTWPAFSQLTASRGLLCLWIGPQKRGGHPGARVYLGRGSQKRDRVCPIQDRRGETTHLTPACFSPEGTPLSPPPRNLTDMDHVHQTAPAF